MRNANRWIVLAALVAAPCAWAQQVPAVSEERQEELQRLDEDPKIQRANEAWLHATRAAIREHVRQYAARGDAHSLLAAAMLDSGFSSSEAQDESVEQASSERARAWFEAARRARPRDLLVAHVESRGCQRLSEHCEAKDALDFLLQNEAGNATVQLQLQLQAMGVAERAGDAAAAERYWQAAAKATEYTPHVLDITRLLRAGMEGVEYPPLDPQLAHAMGVWFGLQRPAVPADFATVSMIAIGAAMTMPAFQPLTQRCKPSLLEKAEATLRTQCEHVLERVAADETNVTSQLIGLGTLVRIQGDGDRGRATRERLRQFYWVFENAMHYLTGTRTGALPAEYGDWFMREGEIAAMRRMIAHHGIPARAPQDWLPEDPRFRSLVTTGKELVGVRDDRR